MVEFTEVADRVWVSRQPWLDVNVTAIGSEAGLLVVDTHGSTSAAQDVIAALGRLPAGEVVAVVNTHVHFDHVFGNSAFCERYGPLRFYAHESVPEDLPRHRDQLVRDYAADPPDDHGPEILATPILAPDQVFSSVRVVDLGDRAVELVHPGRGHTRGDITVRLADADADVLVAGDLVEESGPPALGPDCWPMDWPLTLDLALGLTTPDTVIVPGHGAVVNRDYVQDQRAQLGVLAETIRDLAGRGVPVDRALADGTWPWDPTVVGHAVRRGYQQLPRSQRRLPLV